MSASRPAHRIFTVPPGQPFLDAVARAVLNGDLPVSDHAPDALALPRYTLLLPTRRAVRACREAFLKAGGGRAMLLPQIRPIAEGQQDLDLMDGRAEPPGLDGEGEPLPPMISALERRLALTSLVLAWSASLQASRAGAEAGIEPVTGVGARTPAQAARLAAELARLVDEMETEGVAFTGLDALVPEMLSEHWQQTIEFLSIVTEALPAHLSERGYISPAAWRNRLILAEAERLGSRPPAAPFIVAGVTGSVPATAALMRAVARSPNGAIVLPGLDQDVDAETWDGLLDGDAGHPQFGLRKVLDGLGVAREDVRKLPGCELPPAVAMRNRIVGESMRPASTTPRWREFAAAVDKAAVHDALAGVSLLETASAQDEAEAIALMLREAAEHRGRTAALVSPDRLLARRVAARLGTWGIRVDDSAGRPLAKTVPGAFLDLVADAVSTDFAPVPVMALLKHPLTRLGLPVAQVRRRARHLEISAFRTAYLGRGMAGIEAALERSARDSTGHRAARRLGEADVAAARDLVQRLAAAFAPLSALFRSRERHALSVLVKAHAETAEALAQTIEGERSQLWQGEAGEAAARAIAELMNDELPAPRVTAADYPDFYRTLTQDQSVRSQAAVYPRLFIWGPFEARLQQTDLMILGSLNEGTWPAAADPGAWLNRPMRKALGLPAPEEEIGRAAHDITLFLAAGEVVLTRASKVDGVPTVPSRWLMRLQALLAGAGVKDALAPKAPWLSWARWRDHADRRQPVAAPEPRPPLAARPRRISVSSVERWIANPYAIFARDVLALDPMPALGKEPGPQEKGQIVHEALSRFATRFPDRLPDDVRGSFIAMLREVLDAYAGHPRVAAFWLPRFARFAQWFSETEPDRRRGVERLVAEVEGAHVLPAPAGPFTLRGRADRLDVAGRDLVITDYKTGALPNDVAVRSGSAPQLPLEAAIAAHGGFAGLDAMPVRGLRYIRATGAEPPGEERIVNGGDVAALADAALDGLQRLIARFDDPATPYRAMRRARFTYTYDDYAHLARVGEWSGNGAGEEEEP